MEDHFSCAIVAMDGVLISRKCMGNILMDMSDIMHDDNGQQSVALVPFITSPVLIILSKMERHYCHSRDVVDDIDASVQPVKNLRDVMQVASMYDRSLRGIWFRSGDILNMDKALLTKFKTIISFRAREDTSDPGDVSNDKMVHIPFHNDLNVYDYANSATLKWLKDVIISISSRTALGQLPLLFHCFSGKDRTGVVAATLQYILGVPKEIIIDDYNNSDGKLFPDLFEAFLDHLYGGFLLEDLAEVPAILRHATAPHDDHTSSHTHPPTNSHFDDGLLPVIYRRLSCGYLPRNIQLHYGNWKWYTDGNGRLSRCTGLILPHSPHTDTFSHATSTVQHGSSHDLTYLRSKGFRWRPLIPLCLGGVSSLFNEVYLHEQALLEYSKLFGTIRMLLLAQNSPTLSTSAEDTNSQNQHPICAHVDIHCYYYANVDHPHGISRPDYITIVTLIGESISFSQGSDRERCPGSSCGVAVVDSSEMTYTGYQVVLPVVEISNSI